MGYCYCFLIIFSLVLLSVHLIFNLFLASGDFCRIFIIYANSLDPDLDPNCLTLVVFLKDNFLERLILKKVSRRQQKLNKLPSMQRVNVPPKITMFVGCCCHNWNFKGL